MPPNWQMLNEYQLLPFSFMFLLGISTISFALLLAIIIEFSNSISLTSRKKTKSLKVLKKNLDHQYFI